MDWRSPNIPPEVIDAAERARLWEMPGQFGARDRDRSAHVENVLIETTHGDANVTVFNRQDNGDAADLARLGQFFAAANRAADQGQSSGGPHGQPDNFFQTLMNVNPRVPITKTLIAINVAVFVLMALTGVNMLRPDVESLRAWGANFGPESLGNEQWRMLTCAFLHGGLIHIGFNMYVLWDGGNIVERLVGKVGFLIIYFASALAGSMASLWWNPTLTSVGASGAVFGVFGAMIGFLMLRREAFHAAAVQRLMRSGGTFLALNLIIGASISFIDNAAHIGGMAAGLLCGLVMSRPVSEVAVQGRWKSDLAGLTLAVVGLAVGYAALPPPPSDVMKVAAAFQKLEEAVLDQYAEARQSVKDNNMTAEEYADLIEEEILPPWRKMMERLNAIENVPQPQERLIEQIKRHAELKEAAWRSEVEAIREAIGRNAGFRWRKTTRPIALPGSRWNSSDS